MGQFEAPYQIFQGQESSSAMMPVYATEHAMQAYALAQQQEHASMYALSAQTSTKPRLQKGDVEILEASFGMNHKPTTQTKRGYAESMGVELNRINNWFQNRRAKQKNLVKQEEYRLQNKDLDQFPVEDSSDDLDDLEDDEVLNEGGAAANHTSTMTSAQGPPPAVAPFNPRYANPATASMESLQRTIAAAQAAQHSASPEHDHTFLEPLAPQGTFTLACNFYNSEPMSYPVQNEPVTGFDGLPNYSYSNSSDSQHVAMQQIPEANDITSQSYEISDSNIAADVVSTVPGNSFPSQLVLLQNNGPSFQQSNAEASSSSPETTGETSIAPILTFGMHEADDRSTPLPSSSLPRAPPSAGIASRRPKVHKKPAALGLDLARGRPQMGPRTVSHAEGFRRPNDSPMGSPMRRIVSAGGNRIGRVQKSGIESAQRSPINFGNFPDAESFMEHNLHNIRNASFSSNNLAPPTPLSPNDRFVGNLQSNGEGSSNPFMDMATYACTEGTYFQVPQPIGHQSQAGEQTFASPPVTPENALGLNITTNQDWNTAVFPEHDWYGVPEVPDIPIFTPAQDSFNQLELQMPQPGYVHSLSQPVTPAMYQYPPNVFLNQESSPLDGHNEMYSHSFPGQQEYNFPDSNAQYYVSPATQQKTFQFSNSTPADFSEK